MKERAPRRPPVPPGCVARLEWVVVVGGPVGSVATPRPRGRRRRRPSCRPRPGEQVALCPRQPGLVVLGLLGDVHRGGALARPRESQPARPRRPARKRAGTLEDHGSPFGGRRAAGRWCGRAPPAPRDGPALWRCRHRRPAPSPPSTHQPGVQRVDDPAVGARRRTSPAGHLGVTVHRSRCRPTLRTWIGRVRCSTGALSSAGSLLRQLRQLRQVQGRPAASGPCTPSAFVGLRRRDSASTPASRERPTDQRRLSARARQGLRGDPAPGDPDVAHGAVPRSAATDTSANDARSRTLWSSAPVDGTSTAGPTWRGWCRPGGRRGANGTRRSPSPPVTTDSERGQDGVVRR